MTVAELGYVPAESAFPRRPPAHGLSIAHRCRGNEKIRGTDEPDLCRSCLTVDLGLSGVQTDHSLLVPVSADADHSGGCGRTFHNIDSLTGPDDEGCSFHMRWNDADIFCCDTQHNIGGLCADPTTGAVRTHYAIQQRREESAGKTCGPHGRETRIADMCPTTGWLLRGTACHQLWAARGGEEHEPRRSALLASRTGVRRARRGRAGVWSRLRYRRSRAVRDFRLEIDRVFPLACERGVAS